MALLVCVVSLHLVLSCLGPRIIWDLGMEGLRLGPHALLLDVRRPWVSSPFFFMAVTLADDESGHLVIATTSLLLMVLEDTFILI